MNENLRPSNTSNILEKSLTGIVGLDEITYGGLPKGRVSLVCGQAGSGKSILSMEFLVNGIKLKDEAGLYISFEEKEEDIKKNMYSFGWNVDQLIEDNKLLLEYFKIDKSEIEETGEYNLEGLFLRLESAINLINAKRIVIDTIENLFSGFNNEAILRSEIRRLFAWLKEKNMTAIVTGEQGTNQLSLTRNGIEEYVSDCVIHINRTFSEQLSIRRIKIIKYRGSTHGPNEYPFIINENGISVLPITSVQLEYEVSTEMITTGIPKLDNMLGGKGFYKGSAVLISGSSGIGKSTFASTFANSNCERGERVLYLGFEESKDQLIRNLKTINIDLKKHLISGQLMIQMIRPTLIGMEEHLSRIYKLVSDYIPHVVILDPISTFNSISLKRDTQSMLTRLLDFLKSKKITSIFTYFQKGDESYENTSMDISSLIDTWILLKNIEYNGERTRSLYIIKSRGMAHSNQSREFVIGKKGIELIIDVDNRIKIKAKNIYEKKRFKK
ncbi:MAG: circadian clock protein KaiC [Oligoflexia bacterium]|nr:circadian clock protein KaiC [Oligoflexia bacterium]